MQFSKLDNLAHFERGAILLSFCLQAGVNYCDGNIVGLTTGMEIF